MTQQNLLVTGGAGFIGANYINLFCKKNPSYKVINLDKLTYAADLKNINEMGPDQYHFIHGDVCDAVVVKKIFQDFNITGVVHFAAESHVDNSILDPEAFVKTNVNGTFNLLHYAYKTWMNAPYSVKLGCEEFRFHHISTDEVYGSLGQEGKFKETTPYAPNSPYSASKAAADFLVRSYFRTFGLNTVTTNCSNNYGPFQNKEKFIPVIIRKALNEDYIPIYGDGENIRDWLFVADHCEAIINVFFKGKAGETYNIGGNEERTNIDLCHTICRILDRRVPRSNGKSYSELIKFVEDRPGHDQRYAVDCSKLEAEIGWRPQWRFEDGIEATVNWYMGNNHS